MGGGAGAKTYAPGQAPAPAQASPSPQAGPRRPLQHELMAPGGGGGPSVLHDPDGGNAQCVAAQGSFVLDPAIAGASAPANLVTAVRVAGPDGQQQLVQLQRKITASQRIVVYAVRRENTTPDGKCLAPGADPQPGDKVNTPNGPITVHSVQATNYVEQDPPQIVTTQDQTPDAIAAGGVVLLWTDAGTVLIEAGLQLDLMTDPRVAGIIGEALAGLTATAFGSPVVGEAVLGGMGQHVLPLMAGQLQVQSIRATRDQYEDGSVADVLKRRKDYKNWLEAQVRAKLDGDRARWEATQPIATNASIREQRWQAHVDAEVAAALGGVTPTNLHVIGTTPGGALDLDTDTAPVEQAPEPVDSSVPGAALDLTGVEWEPTDESALVYAKNGLIAPFTQIGLVLKPKGTPATPPAAPKPPGPTHVPELKPAGPTGLGPHTPRSVRPWVALAAIGDEGMTLVRVAGGMGYLIDAGGLPRFIALDALIQMSTGLGITAISHVGITHAHEDHTRSLVEVIKRNNIPASNLVLSRSWKNSPFVKELQALATPGNPKYDAKLKDLGYGASDWSAPGKEVAPTGTTATGTPLATHTPFQVGDTTIDMYANARRNVDMEERQRTNTDSAVHVDRAAALYVFGNEKSPARTAVVQDLRGADLTELDQGLAAQGGLMRAMKGVTVINGLGHHFGTAAGQTEADVAGIQKLLEATLVQNGELTIIVQSSEQIAFGDGKTPTTVGREGALLRYLQRQGVRVVFAGDSTGAGNEKTGAVTTSTGTGYLDTNGNVTTQGTGVRVIAAVDPRQAAIQRRLRLLTEARNMLQAHPDFAVQSLGLEGNADALRTQLDTEITRIQDAMKELGRNASADFFDARGVNPKPGAEDFTKARGRAKYRASVATARTDADILTDAEQKGPIEQRLTVDVIDKLESAANANRSLALDLEFAHMPTDVATQIDKIPDEKLRKSLAAKYAELSAITKELEGDNVPAEKKAEVLIHATELRDQLRAALATVPDPKPTGLTNEAERLDRVVTRLTSDATRDVVVGRDAGGHQTKTQYLKFNNALGKGMHALGRGMGALMVIHSISEAFTDVGHAMNGDFTLPQAGFQFAHTAYGINLGVRMARTTMAQAAAGVGPKTIEFAILALLEVGAVATANYKSSEERRAAMINAGAHATVDLLCMTVGQQIVEWSMVAPAHPIVKLLGVGLGLAVMTAGSRVASMLGMDEWLERKMDWLPDHLHDLVKNIDDGMKVYRQLIGARQLAGRTPEELAKLGVVAPSTTQQNAQGYLTDNLAAVRTKEDEITKLFELAYPEARESEVGLQVLDQQSTEFMRLRQEAFRDHDDPAARAALEQRWQTLDAGMDLSNLSVQQVDNMQQWSKLNDKFDELDGVLADDPPDQAKVLDAFGKLQLMISNARYRIDPTQGGQRDALRARGLFAQDTAGRGAYLAQLDRAEKRLAGYQRVLGDLTYGGKPEAAVGATDLSPSATLRTLRTARTAYDTTVTDVAGAHTNLASDELWRDPTKLVPALEQANRSDRAGFSRVRYRELALAIAADQATSSLAVAKDAPPDLVRRTIEEEVRAARLAIQQRKTGYGLVFADEIDEVRAQVSARAQHLLAIAIDAPQPGGPAPLSPEELEALHSPGMGIWNRGTSTTEAQLAKAQKAIDPFRAFDPNIDATKNWDMLSRSMPQLATLTNPYETEEWYGYPDQSYAGGLHPLVAVAGETRMFQRVAMQKVIAVNADARAVLGTAIREVSLRSLRRVMPEDLMKAPPK